MKRRLACACAPLFLVLAAACQSAPATTAAAADQAPTQTAAADVEVVCRSMKVTGTRFAKRECKTPEAWVEYDAYTNQNAREATDKVQRLNSGPAASAN
ncbi:MAG: hypothetical protein V7675_00525 [Hyphomonas sp.]|uniref:hypothetical protein n=1 Tax=Hyphomonas sp. TaxID=87 RepID=UPI0030027219